MNRLDKVGLYNGIVIVAAFEKWRTVSTKHGYDDKAVAEDVFWTFGCGEITITNLDMYTGWK